jgi:hypothetical protein
MAGRRTCTRLVAVLSRLQICFHSGHHLAEAFAPS